MIVNKLNKMIFLHTLHRYIQLFPFFSNQFPTYPVEIFSTAGNTW